MFEAAHLRQQIHILIREPQSHTARPIITERTEKTTKQTHTELLCSKSPFPQGKAALIHHKSRERIKTTTISHPSSYQSSSAKLPSSASGT